MLALLKKWLGLAPPPPTEPVTRDIPATVDLEVAGAAKTDVGCVRPLNEDHYYLPSNGTADPAERDFLAIVADGMGGHAAGEVASRLATETISAAYFASSKKRPAEALADSFATANQAIYEQGQADASHRGMGTTCTALLIRSAQLWYAHVGDSRLYRLRDGQLTQLTVDQTWVQEMVRRGKMTAQEAAKHEDKHMLLHAMGTKPTVPVDISSGPIPVAPFDRFLLCSDGVHDLLDEAEIQELLSLPDLNNAADQLVDRAREKGGPDNITVVVLEVQPRRAHRTDDIPTRDLKIDTQS